MSPVRYNWRFKKDRDGGVLQDVGVHLIDLIHFISGDTITSIKAMANPSYANESEHTVVAIGNLSDKTLISLECSLQELHKSGFEIIGTKSSLVSTNSLRQRDSNTFSLRHVQNDDSSVNIPLKQTNTYVEELTHFAQVLRGETSPIIASDIALCNQKVIEAAYASIERASSAANIC